MVNKPFLYKPTKTYPLTSTISPTANFSTTATSSLLADFSSPIPTVNSTVSTAETSEAVGMHSHMLFFFSTVLLFVAVAIVVKIIISSRNGGGRGSMLDSWRGLSTSRSSSQSGRLSLGGGPAIGISMNGEGVRGGAGLSLGSTTASYTAMPTSAAAASRMEVPPPQQESRLDWERQFFDDDDEEHLASNMEEEPRTESRLQLHLNR